MTISSYLISKRITRAKTAASFYTNDDRRSWVQGWMALGILVECSKRQRGLVLRNTVSNGSNDKTNIVQK